jgi:hypothetical protein
MRRLKSVIQNVTRTPRSRRTERSRNLREPRSGNRLPREKRPRRRNRSPSRRRRDRTPPRRRETPPPRSKTPPRAPSPNIDSDSDISLTSTESNDTVWSPTRLKIDEMSPVTLDPEPPKPIGPPPPPPPKKAKVMEKEEITVTRQFAESDVETDEDEVPQIIAEYLRKEERKKKRYARRAFLRRKKINAKILEASSGADVRLIERTAESAFQVQYKIIQLLKLIRHHAVKNRLNSKEFWASSKSGPLRTLMNKLSRGQYMSLFHNSITSMEQRYFQKKKNHDAKKNTPK